MFYFQELLNQALSGIEGTSILSTVIGIAYAILLIGFLIGLYQAAMRGGDLQMLAVTAIKYLVIAIILANWSTVFRQVNGAFNDVAQSIANSSGAGDTFTTWMDQLRQQYDTTGNQSLWDLITGTQAGMIAGGLVLVAYILYACALVVFSFFYSLYGSVLYVLGPLVLAVLPMSGIGQLARTYATNVMIWNAWGLLYAIFGALMTAVHVNDVNNVLNQQGLLGYFHGLGDTDLLGLISIFYALALALIPLIAKRIIAGDVGSSAMSLVRAGVFVASNAVGAISGFAAGAGGSAGGSAAASGGSGAAMGASATSASPAVQGAMSSSMPPPVPAAAGFSQVVVMSSGGGYRPHGLAQTVGYHAGRAAKSALGSSGDDDA
jgi:hypothetical protein